MITLPCTYMLQGGLIPSLAETLRVLKNQWFCLHSTWILDSHSLHGSVPTKHCRHCWKTVAVSDPRFVRFGWRLERAEEFQARVRAAGG